MLKQNRVKTRFMALLLCLAVIAAFLPVSPALAADGDIVSISVDGDVYSRSALEGRTFNRDFNADSDYLFQTVFAVSGYDSYMAQLSVDGSIKQRTLFDPALGENFSFTPYTIPADNNDYAVEIALFGSIDGQESLLDKVSFTLVFGDIVPPQLTDREPANNATDVPVTATVSAVFSEGLDEATVTAANIYINDKSSSLSYDRASRTITLTPNSKFSGLTEYTVTVKNGGLKDLAGNGIAGSSWKFRTSADPAATPVIESRQPAAGATNVPVNSNVVITLSKPLDVTTVNSSSVTLKKGSTSVAATVIPVSTNSSGKGTITIDPSGSLDNAAVYTVAVSGLKDTNGLTVASSSWSFTTEPGALPTVATAFPAADSTRNAIGVHPTIKFSKAMSSATITSTSTSTANIWLSKTNPSGSRVSADVTYNSSTLTATIIPDADLSYSTTYYVNIDRDVKDSGGNAIAPVSWKFSTGSSNTATVSNRVPADKAADVAADTTVTFKFSQDMYRSSINEDTVTLRRTTASSEVNADVEYDSDTRLVTLTPDDDLAFDAEYVVYVSSGVRDADRDAITPVTWYFSTAEESNLRITSRSPGSGDDDIALTSKVTVKFSDTLRSSSVNTSTFYLRASGTTSNVPATVSYSSSTRTVTITPSSPLKSDTQYTVYVTSGLRDSDGAAFDSTSWKFRTRTVTVKLSDIKPAAGSTGVSINPAISCTFSETMDRASITAGSFYLKNTSTNRLVAATIAYNATARTASLKPSSPLEYGTQYTVTITDDARSTEGGSVPSKSWSFTTAEKSQVGTATRPVVKVDGKFINFTDAHPYITNGRTMIPFRALFESMGATVSYDANTKKVTGSLNGNTVILYIGRTTAYRNGSAITLDVPPVSLDGRVYIPLRFAGESLGGQVVWDASTYTVIITTP